MNNRSYRIPATVKVIFTLFTLLLTINTIKAQCPEQGLPLISTQPWVLSEAGAVCLDTAFNCTGTRVGFGTPPIDPISHPTTGGNAISPQLKRAGTTRIHWKTRLKLNLLNSGATQFNTQVRWPITLEINGQVLVNTTLGVSETAEDVTYEGDLINPPDVTNVKITYSGQCINTEAFYRSGVEIYCALDYYSTKPIEGPIEASPSFGSPGTLISVIGYDWLNSPPGSEYQLLLEGQTTPVARQSVFSCNTQPQMSFKVPCLSSGGRTLTCRLVNLSTQQVLLTGTTINFNPVVSQTPCVSVTITPFTAVPKDGLINAKVSVLPSPSNAAITLTLSTISGTGTAVFETNKTNALVIPEGTTADPQSPIQIPIRGVKESSDAGNIELTAKVDNSVIAKVLEFGQNKSTQPITVLQENK
jgi:hypothetical protein